MAPSVRLTSHSIARTDLAGHKIVFKGDFVIDNGTLTGGTVHGFDVYYGSTKVLTATGYSVAFSQVQAAIEQIRSQLAFVAPHSPRIV